MKITSMVVKYKNTHEYGFRKDEWGVVTGLVRVKPSDIHDERLCYQVTYEDGFVDYFPIYDEGNYDLG